jgi:phytoene desaturase
VAGTVSAGRRPVVVVGAGFGGLAAACHLRGAGHDVLVLEAADGPGGRAGLAHHDGFRFDRGPTVVTMPGLLDAAFAAVGAARDDFCRLDRLDPAYRACFADGSELRLRAGLDDAASEIERFAGPADAAAFRDHVRWLTSLHDAVFEPFIAGDIRSVLDLARQPVRLARLAAQRGFGSWDAQVRRTFADERLHRLFTFQAMYAGVSPLDALGLFAVISFMDTVEGVYAAQGGTHALADGLARAAAKAGVELWYGATVRRIVPGGGRGGPGGRGPRVELADGSVVEAAAVVANPDLPICYEELLDVVPPRSVRRARPSPSCLVWHVAARGALPMGTTHHTIHFGGEWGAAFDDLFVRGRPMRDPSRFVTVGSQSDPDAAPRGGHALYLLEPVPHLGADVDWSRETGRLTERMWAWAEAAGYPMDGAELVTVIDPPGWRRDGAWKGTPFSAGHRFGQSGPFRTAPEDRRLPGVVFCGAATRPGVGIPMVLISGRIAAERTHRNLTSGPHR